MEVPEWQKWLNEQRAQSKMVVEEIPLTSVEPPWGMQIDGNYRREPPGYFNIHGLRIRTSPEAKPWTQPVLAETGKGYIVLVESVSDGTTLLRTRQEPGNPASKNYVLLGSTLQTSETNLKSNPPYAEILSKYDVRTFDIPQDGNRFYQKVNKYGVLRVPSQKEITLRPDARWFNDSEVYEAVLYGETNEFLLQVLSFRHSLRNLGI
ncbi:hypothetical protein EPN87_04075 [archaeon]|nr:MAG: hypothetical protein EPN87_04075 [archaeon]